MVTINFPDVSYAKTEMSLGGLRYKFIYYFNESDNRWRIDIIHDDEPVVSGLKVVESTSLIRSVSDPIYFNHGDLICIKSLQTNNEAGRNNVGVGKEFKVLYLTNEELNIG